MTDKDKTAKTASDSAVCSADNVDSHLRHLENKTHSQHGRTLSPEDQLFTEEELARLINPDKLEALLNSGDDLLGYLTREIDKFAE